MLTRAEKANLFDILNTLPHEVDAFKAALVNDKIDGGAYGGANCCLAGTICKKAMPRGDRALERAYLKSGLDDDQPGGVRVSSPSGSFVAHPGNPIEQFVADIAPGDGSSESERTRALVLAGVAEWEVKHKAKALKKWSHARQKTVVLEKNVERKDYDLITD